MATVALDRWDDTIQVFLLDGAVDSIFAIWGGAPFQVLFVIDIGACKQQFVSDKQRSA